MGFFRASWLDGCVVAVGAVVFLFCFFALVGFVVWLLCGCVCMRVWVSQPWVIGAHPQEHKDPRISPVVDV